MRRARAVVLCVAAGAAGALVRPLAPAAAYALAAIDYAPVAVAASAYRRADIAHALAGFGFLVPKKERRSILGTLFSSSMFAGRAPEDAVLLTSFIGGRRNPDLPARPDDELARLVHAELAALVGATGAPLWTEITRWPQAIPQYDLGHRERLRPARRRPKRRCRDCASARATAAECRSATASSPPTRRPRASSVTSRRPADPRKRRRRAAPRRHAARVERRRSPGGR